MLAVDVQQLTPQLPQLGHGHQPPVHPADIPAVPLDLPLEEQLLLRRAPRSPPASASPDTPVNTALTKADFAPVRISSRLVRSPSTALMASTDDGLARSGLTGQSVEARIELDIGPTR